mmetsp:Transcript_1099/g.1529  ORF Transcript_1099/g.1529 Transcript_1099/m.1529 type:complete len:333 (+) Transcript_1099:86-1084(+)
MEDEKKVEDENLKEKKLEGLKRSLSASEIVKMGKSDTTSELTRLEREGRSELWWIDPKEVELREDSPKFGRISIIRRANWRHLGIAVKSMKDTKRYKSNLEELIAEIKVWRTLRHPNIVMFLGASYRPELGLMIMLEFMSGGTLQDYLFKRKKINPEKNWKCAYDIASAMAFLHACTPPVIHGDLQPHNILFNEHGVAKIGDFGLSKFVQGTPLTNKSKKARARYLAPEFLLWFSISLKSDVYAFGMILLDLFTAKLYHDKTKSVAELNGCQVDYLKIAKNGTPIDCKMVKDKVAKVLVQECTRKDVKVRFSFEQVTEYIENIQDKKACTIM